MMKLATILINVGLRWQSGSWPPCADRQLVTRSGHQGHSIHFEQPSTKNSVGSKWTMLNAQDLSCFSMADESNV